MRLDGTAAAVIAGERAALAFVTHLSGIATATRQFAEAIAGTNARIGNPRSATPGLRPLENYAVNAAGGATAREKQSGAILLTRNHILLAGGIKAALDGAHSYASLRRDLRATTAYEAVGSVPTPEEAASPLIQIEVQNESELREALERREAQGSA